MQRLLDPLQRLAADNCHLTRDTGVLLRTSSLFSQVGRLAADTRMQPLAEVCEQRMAVPESYLQERNRWLRESRSWWI